MSDLFSATTEAASEGPLADRMRPQVLDDILGQDHIVGPGRLLRRAIQADRLSSVIFYGPPGTGKTSLARVIANTTRSQFESLNAVLTGVKDVREAIDRSDERRRLYGRRSILFVDEVHRWNKAQQDALLPWVENGTVILIGATTENPFFEVNRALVSRSRIFQLKALTSADLLGAAKRAVGDPKRGYGQWRVVFEAGALEHLVEVSSGDARSLLNALELAVETSPESWPPPAGAEIFVSFGAAEESIQRRAVLYDRDGDYHFDTISAFIKSIRGSDPDAALYWLAKMVRAGEDPSFIFRRMIISASEDVGLAAPEALQVVMACAQAFDRIGFPEGNFPLAHAALYLATAPKSNTAMAFFDALGEVDREDAEVPNHLRDGSRDKEGFGHGEGYIYPHAYRDHWAAQQYLPTALRGRAFYIPSISGYEGKIREGVLQKREIQAAVVLGDAMAGTADRAEGEILTWSAASKGREGWYKRLESGRSRTLLEDRDTLFRPLKILRHHRILIAAADDGLLLWEALRKTPEGLAAAAVSTQAAKDALIRYARTLDETEQPRITVVQGTLLPSPEEARGCFGTDRFDFILAREPWRKGFFGASAQEAFRSFAAASRLLLDQGTCVSVLQSPPKWGQRIGALLKGGDPEAEELAMRLEKAEDVFFNDPSAKTLSGTSAGAPAASPDASPDAGAAQKSSRWTWDPLDIEQSMTEVGLFVETSIIEHAEERVISEKDIGMWFDQEHSPWGKSMAEQLGNEDCIRLRQLFSSRASAGPMEWRWKTALLRCAIG